MKTSNDVKLLAGTRLVGMLILAFAALSLIACTSETTHAKRSAADDEFDKGMDRPPTPKTLYTMARILISQGREGEAQYILVRIIHDEPNFVPAYCAMAEMQLRAQKVDEAEKTLLAGFAKAPNDAVLLNDLGMCKVARGDYEGALVYFKRASQAEPRTTRYTANQAMALGMLGRYDESLEVYYRTVTPEFTPADAHHNVAVLCEARGDAERAASEFALANQIREQLKKEKGARKESRPVMLPPAKPTGQAAAPSEAIPGKAEKPE